MSRLRGGGGLGGVCGGGGAHPPPGQGRQGQGAKAERRLLAAVSPPPPPAAAAAAAVNVRHLEPPSNVQWRAAQYTDGRQRPVFQPHSDTHTRQPASTLMSTLISFPLPKNHAVYIVQILCFC